MLSAAYSQRARPGDQDQDHLGRDLVSIASRWVTAIAHQLPQAHAAQPELYREMLAYAFCRLEPQLADRPEQRARVLTVWRETPTQFRRPALDPGQPASDSACSFADTSRVALLARSGPRALTREAFEQFCLNTGLGSDVLVGRRESLAPLLLYIVMHAVLLEAGPLSRGDVATLLKLAQGARTELEKAIRRWGQATDPREPAASPTGRLLPPL